MGAATIFIGLSYRPLQPRTAKVRQAAACHWNSVGRDRRCGDSELATEPDVGTRPAITGHVSEDDCQFAFGKLDRSATVLAFSFFHNKLHAGLIPSPRKLAAAAASLDQSRYASLRGFAGAPGCPHRISPSFVRAFLLAAMPQAVFSDLESRLNSVKLLVVTEELARVWQSPMRALLLSWRYVFELKIWDMGCC